MIQTTFDALSNGGLYAIAALGIGLVFGVLRLVNFAHGEVITIGAYLLVTVTEVPLFPRILLALAACAALAFCMEAGVFRRLRLADPAVLLIASFGLSTLLQRIYEQIFGSLPRSGQVAPWLTGRMSIAGADVSRISAVTLVLTVVLLAVVKVLVDRTSWGLQIRAASSDFKTARLLGVRANRVISSAFVGSGLLAGVVAFLVVAQRNQVDPRFGVNITILALVGTVIGGLGSLEGAVLGGFLVGAAISLLNSVLGNARPYTYSVLFACVIVVLVLRPGGLIGSGTERERV